MPWKVEKTDSCPAGKPWGVVKEDDGEVEGCHETQEKAQAQQAALYASEERGIMSKFREFFDRLRGLVAEIDTLEDGEPETQERAVAMGQVAEQFWGLLSETERWDAWPLDLYLDGERMYALVAERGKLYRVDLSLDGAALQAGDWTEVETVHQPVGRTRVTRQADGRYRWINISATAALNRVAEIDSRALFDDFIRRAEETGEYPQRDFFHLGEAAIIGQADLLARDDAVFITSGTFNDTPLAQALVRAIEAEPGEWGDSISYLPQAEPELVEVVEGVRVPVYSAGVLRFIATLPEERAASLFTTTRVQEVGRMRQEIKDLLGRLTQFGLPEEEIENIEARVDSTNREIAEGGIINRDAETEPETDTEPDAEPAAEPVDADAGIDREAEPEAETEQEPEAEPEDRQIELDEAALGAIVDRVLAAEAVAGLFGRLDALEGENQRLRSELQEARALNVKRATDVDRRLAALERDDETKRREWQADLPERARGRTTVTYRPREAKAQDPVGEGDQPDMKARAEATLASWPKPN